VGIACRIACLTHKTLAKARHTQSAMHPANKPAANLYEVASPHRIKT